MLVSRKKLVLGLVTIFWLGLLASIGMAADSGCLKCHPPHRTGQGDCVSCHAGNPGTQRREIGHDRLIAARFASYRDPLSPIRLRGKKLVEALGCRRCHRIGDQGNRLATDLDLLSDRITPEMREKTLESPTLFMPDFRLGPSDRAAIVTYLLAVRQQAKRIAAPPKVIHFVSSPRLERTFEKHCGACHQLLSVRRGALGRGRLGPNLSGLFSRFYPNPPKADETWNAKNLERWLKNPRFFRPYSLMPPLKLEEKDISDLVLNVKE